MFFHRFRNRVGAVIESHIRITVPTGQGEGDGRTINLHLRRDHKRNSLDPDILLGIDAG